MGIVLVVEDEVASRKQMAQALLRQEHTVLEAGDGEEAIKVIRENDVDVIVSDIRMPNVSGMDVLKAAKKHDPSIVVIMVTAYGDVQTAVEAMKDGAFDFLEKPISMMRLRELVNKGVEIRRGVLENRALKESLKGRFTFENIVARSRKMLEIFDVVRQVAPTKATVLLTGESGTGKELIANAIHYNSPRAGKPLVKVNCAALPETLLESELFGHEKGAFTGAYQTRIGRFESADGGTLFLDEIGAMSLALQVKLLRVLQESEFERVGGNKTIRVDVRLVAATNTDLQKAVSEGKFREDLYYRVNVVRIELPPLRERKEDIPFLVEHFLKKYSEENLKKVERVDSEAMAALLRYNFPGNVRELENIIESGVVLAKGNVITLDMLPPPLRVSERETGKLSIPVGVTMKEAERAVIEATLKHTGGNRTEAARILKLGRRTLFRKIKEYGVAVGRARKKSEDKGREKQNNS
ncbi:MAG: sigma-54 dependent transcriptional regulator [Planctomycetota bacterium]|nr:sigma-54 dependent transcriptional regulator [Planctomycetota bacterium]